MSARKDGGAVDRIKAGAELAQELERARGQIHDIRGQLRAVEGHALPLDAALARAKAMVDAAKLPRMNLRSFMREDDGPPRIDLTMALAENQSGVLVALAAAEVGRQLEAQLKAAYRAPGLKTMPAAERQKRVAELEDRLFDAELAEERLVRRLEAVGADPDRRADASPAIVLATLED